MKALPAKKPILIGLAVLGLALAGLAASRSGDSGNSSLAGGTDVASTQPDPYLASIDKALGRDASAPAPATAANDSHASSAVQQSEQGGSSKSSAPPGSPAPTGAATSLIDSRKIVQTASLSLQVKEVGGSFDQVGLLATGAGGFVASSKFSLVGDQQVASITIRVPADRYQDVLSQVRALGAKVDTESSNASDVTEEFTDLSAQVSNLRATEQQLLSFLAQAKNVAEVLQVQDRLTAVRSDIERLQGRINLLNNLSDMATISVQLRPVAVPVKVDHGQSRLSEAVSDAWEHSLNVVTDIGAGVASVLVFSWWLAILAVPVVFVWQRWLRSRPASPAGGYD